MYLPSDQACSAQSGATPVDPVSFAAVNARTAYRDQQIANAQQEWNDSIAPDWRSFAGLGPQVALQVMESPVVTPFGFPPLSRGVPAKGVQVSGARGSGAKVIQFPLPGGGGSVGTLTPDQSDFVNQFANQLTPYKVYTGPLPKIGTVQSLAYGGSPSNRPQLTATSGLTGNVAVTPQASAGYAPPSECTSPAGVDLLPMIQEPVSGAPGSANLASGGSAALGPAAAPGSDNSWLWWLLAGVAAVALLSDGKGK